MKTSLISLLLSFSMFCYANTEFKDAITTDVTTVYLLRHTEKNMTVESDPPLTETGKRRAKHWAQVLTNIEFDVVYSTDTTRTRETAKPAALANAKEITLYHPDRLTRQSILENHAGNTILVIGHSNTVAKLSNQLIQEERFDDLSEDEYSALFIVSLHETSASAQKLLIDLSAAD